MAIYLAECSLRESWEWVGTSLDVPVAALLAVAALAAVFSVERRTSAWAMLLLANYAVVFRLVVQTVRTRSGLRNLTGAISGVAVFLAVFGLFKKMGANPFPWWTYTDSTLYYEYLESASTYGNPNHFSGYLAMAIPLMAGLLLAGAKGIKRLFLVYFLLVMVLALVLSLSRGGWLAAAFGLAFMASNLLFDPCFERRKLLIAGIGGAVFVSLAVLGSTPVVVDLTSMAAGMADDSLVSRLITWKHVLQIIRDYPLLGTGPGTFGDVFTQYQPPGIAVRIGYAHNDYLQFVSETGLAMVPVMAWMLFALCKTGFEKLKNPSRLVRGTTLGALSGIAAVLFHGLFDFNLHIPANALLFTVLGAIVAAPVPWDTSRPNKPGRQ